MAGGEASGSEAPATVASKVSRMRSGFDEITDMLGSPYVAANILLSSLYIAVRPFYVDKPIREGMLFMGDVHDFAAFERYVGFLCGGYAAFRFFKARSRAAGLQSALDFAQLFVAVMAMVCSPVLLTYYITLYCIIYLLLPQPEAPGLHEHLEHLTPEGLAEDVKAPGSETTWVVLYYTSYSAPCRQMSWDLADLAARYATDRLKFAVLDVGEYYKTAAKLGIDLTPYSPQLPTVVLYEKGEEVMRMPKKQGSSIWGSGFKARDVVRSMELDMRYTRSLTKLKGQ